MKIKSYFKADREGVTYSYTKRHTNNEYKPDMVCEENDCKVYDSKTGNLFAGKEVKWDGTVLLEGSVDINITLPYRIFVDHIDMMQTEDSEPKSIEILTMENKELKKVGLAENCDIDVSIPVGYYTDNVIVRINGNYKPVGIKSFDLCGAEGICDTIYPIPEKMEYTEGILPFNKISAIAVKCDAAMAGAEYFIEKLKNRFAKSISVADDGEIVLSFSDADEESFEVEVTDTACNIVAGSKRGFFYALDALLQLADGNGFKKCKIADKPFMEYRGFHFALPSRKDIPFFKRFVKEMLVPMRYNMVYLQVTGAMRYDNFPEINEAWRNVCAAYERGETPLPPHYNFLGHDTLEKSEVRELCEYIRSFGIEIVAEIQSLSHCQYITMAYPEMAEVPRKKAAEENLYEADERPPEIYPHNLCPSHERYYDVIFGIADEVLEVVRPERFVHFGHDEAYIIGECDKCSNTPAHIIFAEEVKKLNEYAKSKNLKMMIWSDMLQKETYSVPDAIELVPKDIIMLDFTWYFHPEQDLEDRLLEHGFKVIMGNMYSSHYTRFNYRSHKKGMIGAEVSTWVNCNEQSYAYEGKMYDLVYSANTMWSDKYNTEYRLTYNELVKPILWDIRGKIGEICLEGETEVKDFDASMKTIPNELLWNIPYDKAGEVSTESTELEIEINGKAETLLFTHATDISADRVMWTPSQIIGKYDIVYADGEVYSSDICYGENIFKFGCIYATPVNTILFRHEGYMGTYSARPICGKDSRGKDYTLLELPVKNIYPEKEIKKVILKHNGNTDARILLFDVKTLKK